MAEQIDQSTASSEAPRGAASPHLVTVSKRLWKIVLLGGAAVWLLAAVVTEVTDDHVLVPMVIDVGSFLVPVTMVTFALSRLEPFLTLEQIALAFLAAGTLGVVASASLEIYLLPANTGTFLGVGVIEELGKGAVLLAVAYHVHDRAPRNGMVLGAIVGAGFAAFESAGYAVSTLIEHVDDSPIVNIMETEATRALLAPFGHITWTALVGGALFASSRNGSFHVTRRLLLDARRRHGAARAVGSDLRLVDPARRGGGRRGVADQLAARADVVRPTDVRGAAALHGLLRRPARHQRTPRHNLDRALVADVRATRAGCGRSRPGQ